MSSKLLSYTLDDNFRREYSQDLGVTAWAHSDCSLGSGSRYSGIDYARKQKRNLFIFSPTSFRINDPAVTKLAEAEEIENQIKQALDQLLVQQKQVFILCYYQYLLLQEIAEL